MVSGALAPGVITSSAELVDELAALVAEASGVTCRLFDGLFTYKAEYVRFS
jgi:hypothetical protein